MPNKNKAVYAVGNSAYQHAPRLPYASTDARELGGLMGNLGYFIVPGSDLDYSGFRHGLSVFCNTHAEEKFFYFEGYALQSSGKNYLLPTCAQIQTETDVELYGFPLHVIIDQIRVTCKTTIIVVDAARPSPMAKRIASERGTRSLSSPNGLAPMDVAIDTYLCLANSPNRYSLDFASGKSPFFLSFYSHVAVILGGGEDRGIGGVITKVRQDLDALQHEYAPMPWECPKLTSYHTFDNREAVNVVRQTHQDLDVYLRKRNR